MVVEIVVDVVVVVVLKAVVVDLAVIFVLTISESFGAISVADDILSGSLSIVSTSPSISVPSSPSHDVVVVVVAAVVVVVSASR